MTVYFSCFIINLMFSLFSISTKPYLLQKFISIHTFVFFLLQAIIKLKKKFLYIVIINYFKYTIYLFMKYLFLIDFYNELYFLFIYFYFNFLLYIFYFYKFNFTFTMYNCSAMKNCYSHLTI